MDLSPGQAPPDSAPNAFTLQGETYTNRYNKEFARQSIIFPGLASTRSDTSQAAGWHLLGRWQHTLAHGSETILQAYYDYARKDYDPGSGSVSTTDLDFQHRLTLAERHEIVWGVEYRYISDRFTDTLNIAMDPNHLDQSLWSIFIQDEIRILPDLLTLIAGSKFEHNEFTGLEILPSIRVLCNPYQSLSVWAAVSRAVRVPSRLELHGRTSDQILLPSINPNQPVEVTARGNSDLQSEELTAYELGFRVAPSRTLWIDTTFFFSDYDRQIGLETIDSPLPGDQRNLIFKNNTAGEAYGSEVALDWKVTHSWLLRASYTYLHTRMEENLVDDPNIAAIISEGSNPRSLFSVRSLLGITPGFDFDLWLRLVGSLPERNIDRYTVLDARLAWRPYPDLELSLVGQNLLQRGHAEFSSLEVDRSIYGKVDWKY
jgi:iron complex outermembrane receptor protein